MLFTTKSDRNHCIVRLRYENHTLEEIGNIVGLTRERIRQILNAEGVHHIPHLHIDRFKPKPDALFRAAFWDNIDIQDEDECWLWKGGKAGQMGYGRFSWRGRNFYAHRLAFNLYHGVTIKQWARHRCHVPLCCNPLHIYDGSRRDNINDCSEAKRFGYKRPDVHTPSALRDITNRFKAGESRSSIARDYSVSTPTIWQLTS